MQHRQRYWFQFIWIVLGRFYFVSAVGIVLSCLFVNCSFKMDCVGIVLFATTCSIQEICGGHCTIYSSFQAVLSFAKIQTKLIKRLFFLSPTVTYSNKKTFTFTLLDYIFSCLVSLSLFSSSKETLTFTFLQKHWNKLDYVRLPCFNLKETSFNKQPNTIKISRLFPRSCYTIIHPAPDCPWK